MDKKIPICDGDGFIDKSEFYSHKENSKAIDIIIALQLIAMAYVAFNF